MATTKKDLEQGVSKRREVFKHEEADDDDQALLDDHTKKEDKTMPGGERLKQEEKKAEKFGEAVFAHAKKFNTPAPDDDDIQRDENEWND